MNNIIFKMSINQLNLKKRKSVIKSQKKPNKVRTNLLKITYNEMMRYLDKCCTKLNDELPSKIYKNYINSSNLQNPVEAGKRNKAQFMQTTIRQKLQNILSVNLSSTPDNNYPIIDNEVNFTVYLNYRKKDIAHDKLQSQNKIIANLVTDSDLFYKLDCDNVELSTKKDNKKISKNSYSSKHYTSMIKLPNNFFSEDQRKEKVVQESIQKLRNLVKSFRLLQELPVPKKYKTDLDIPDFTDFLNNSSELSFPERRLNSNNCMLSLVPAGNFSKCKVPSNQLYKNVNNKRNLKEDNLSFIPELFLENISKEEYILLSKQAIKTLYNKNVKDSSEHIKVIVENDGSNSLDFINYNDNHLFKDFHVDIFHFNNIKEVNFQDIFTNSNKKDELESPIQKEYENFNIKNNSDDISPFIFEKVTSVFKEEKEHTKVIKPELKKSLFRLSPNSDLDNQILSINRYNPRHSPNSCDEINFTISSNGREMSAEITNRKNSVYSNNSDLNLEID